MTKSISLKLVSFTQTRDVKKYHVSDKNDDEIIFIEPVSEFKCTLTFELPNRQTFEAKIENEVLESIIKPFIMNNTLF
jgi:hypothetical protein